MDVDLTSTSPLNVTDLGNASGQFVRNEGQDLIIVILSRLQKFTNPLFCVLGLLGNIIATTVFLSKSQRTTSCCLYLAARSISDSGFLLALFVVWLSDVNIDAFNIQVICQTVIFLTYICGFLSVWFVVAVTAENCVRICHPFSVKTYCTTKVAKIVIILFAIFAFAVYNFPIWTTKVMTINGKEMCSRIQKYDLLQQILTYTDTFITLVIPTVIIICLVIAITVSVLQLYHRQRLLRGKRVNKKSKNPQGKVTRMLFSVSLIFIVLNLPSHVIRVFMTVSNFAFGHGEPSLTVKAMHYIFQTMYYMNFAVNIIVYLVFGDKFRSEFVRIYLSRIFKPMETISKRGESKTLLENLDKERQVHVTQL